MLYSPMGSFEDIAQYCESESYYNVTFKTVRVLKLDRLSDRQPHQTVCGPPMVLQLEVFVTPCKQHESVHVPFFKKKIGRNIIYLKVSTSSHFTINDLVLVVGYKQSK